MDSHVAAKELCLKLSPIQLCISGTIGVVEFSMCCVCVCVSWGFSSAQKQQQTLCVCVCALCSWLCEKSDFEQRILVLRAAERSNGTHKNKLKSSFPCTCDRIAALWMLNCLTSKLKICIFVPQSLHVCLLHITSITYVCLPPPCHFSAEAPDFMRRDSLSGGSAGLSFIHGKGEEEESKTLHVWSDLRRDQKRSRSSIPHRNFSLLPLLPFISSGRILLAADFQYFFSNLFLLFDAAEWQHVTGSLFEV